MFTFTNITDRELYLKDEYGRFVKFMPRETRSGLSSFLFRYTKEGLDAGLTGNQMGTSEGEGWSAIEMDPVLSCSVAMPEVAQLVKTKIRPSVMVGADRSLKQLVVASTDEAPGATDPSGLYTDGENVWVVSGGNVIPVVEAGDDDDDDDDDDESDGSDEPI